MDKKKSAIDSIGAIDDINENGLEMPYFKNIKEKYGITVPQYIIYILKNTVFSEFIDDPNLQLKMDGHGYYIHATDKGGAWGDMIYAEYFSGEYFDLIKQNANVKKIEEDGLNNIKSFLQSNPSLKPPYFKKLKEIMDIRYLKNMGREISNMFSEANIFGEPVTVVFEIGNKTQPFYVMNRVGILYHEDHDGNYKYHNNLSYLSESTEVKKIKDLMKRINIIK